MERKLNNEDKDKIIKEHSPAIQKLKGANYENSNIDFETVKQTFLTASAYSTDKIKKANIGKYLNTKSIPNINLSNNNFNGYEWQLDDFLIEVRKYVENYISYEYRNEIAKIKELMEWSFDQYGDTTIGDDGSLQRHMDWDIKIIIQKIIPNLKNTKLRINFDLSRLNYADREFLEEILLSDKFDGCYINSSDELYNHNKTIEEKQIINEKITSSMKIKSKKLKI